jgi:hypothetical protein
MEWAFKVQDRLSRWTHRRPPQGPDRMNKFNTSKGRKSSVYNRKPVSPKRFRTRAKQAGFWH